MCALLVLSTSVISTTASSEENEPTVIYNDDGTVTIIGAENWEEASSALRKDVSERKSKEYQLPEEAEDAPKRDSSVFVILCIITAILLLNLIVNIHNRTR